MKILTLALAFIAAVQDQPAAERSTAPREFQGPPPLARPMIPSGEALTDFAQARLRCVVGANLRADCEVVETWADSQAFARAYLRDWRRARLDREAVQPGDVYTFDVWACVVDRQSDGCPKRPWPAR